VHRDHREVRSDPERLRELLGVASRQRALVTAGPTVVHVECGFRTSHGIASFIRSFIAKIARSSRTQIS